ncbi:MAG: hypothetical protein U9N78_00165, partial [Actinomycetota bacterium]|nr:hypothetical protein [Actinomycetota bacterium]
VLPAWAGEAAYPLAAAAGVFGGDAPVCVEMLRTLLHGHRFDSSLSINELGVAYTPLESTLARTVEWLADEGLAER